MRHSYIFILFCALFFYCTHAFAQIEKPNYGLLWEISGKDLPKPTYLFGSMHLPDARLFEFPDSMYILLDACEAFATEIDMDSAMYHMENIDKTSRDYRTAYDIDLGIHVNLPRKKSIYEEEEIKAPPPPIEKKTSKKAKRRYTKIAKKNTSEKDLAPYHFSTGWNKTKHTDKHTFVDAYLAYIAKRHGKTMQGLENIEKHMNMYDDVRSSHKTTLDTTFTGMPDSLVFANMVEYYRSGDLDKIKRIAGNLIGDSIMILRNQIMVESIEEIAKKQTLFSVVGAAHLIGEKGVIDIFKQKGYQVRKITAQFTGVTEKYTFQSPTKNIVWHKHVNEAEGYSFEIPYKSNNSIEESHQINGNAYACKDIFTGATYSFFTFSKKSTSSDSIVDSLRREKSYEIYSKKPFKNKNIAGTEYILYHKFDSIVSIRAQVFYANHQWHIAQIFTKNAYLYEDYANRFFDSIQVHSIEKEMKIFEDKKAGFQVMMYGKPNIYVEKINQQMGGENMQQMLHLYINKNNEDQTINVVRYNDLIGGSRWNSDTLLLNEIEKYVKESLAENDSSYAKKDTTIAGVLSREFVVNRAGKNIAIKAFLRGTRLYIAMSNQDSLKRDTLFMSSFRLLPIQPMQLTRQTFKSGGLSLDFPKEKTEVIDTLLYKSNPFFSASYDYAATEENTGVGFKVQKFQWGKYAYYTNLDSVFTSVEKINLNKNDTIITSKKHLLQGLPTKDIVFKSKYATPQSVLRIMVSDVGIYTFLVYVPQELMGNAKIDTFFRSIEIIPKPAPFIEGKNPLFVSKAAIFIADLQSTDSLKFEKTKHLLSDFSITKAESGIFKNALLLSFPDDTISVYYKETVKKMIWNKLDSLGIDFIKKIYVVNKSKEFKSIILNKLLGFKSQEGLDAFFELIEKKEVNDNEQVIEFFALKDTILLLKKNYPAILSLAKKGAFQSQYLLFEATSALLENDSTQIDFIIAEIPTFVNILTKQLKVLENDSLIPKIYLHKLLFLQLNIAKKLPKNNAISALMKQLLKENKITNDLKIQTLSWLLQQKEVVQYEDIKQMLEDKQNYKICMDLLKIHNKFDIVKEVSLQQITLAESTLINMLSIDEYSFVFLQEAVIRYKGKKRRFYIFQINSKYRPKTNIIGYVGVFPKNKKKFYYKEEKASYADVTEDMSKFDAKKWLRNQLGKKHESLEFED